MQDAASDRGRNQGGFHHRAEQGIADSGGGYLQSEGCTEQSWQCGAAGSRG